MLWAVNEAVRITGANSKSRSSQDNHCHKLFRLGEQKGRSCLILQTLQMITVESMSKLKLFLPVAPIFADKWWCFFCVFTWKNCNQIHLVWYFLHKKPKKPMATSLRALQCQRTKLTFYLSLRLESWTIGEHHKQHAISAHPKLSDSFTVSLEHNYRWINEFLQK